MTGLDHLVKARVDKATHDALVKEAKISERSVGAVVRVALREHLDKKKVRVRT